jgi:PAS domain S-box-containing protein
VGDPVLDAARDAVITTDALGGIVEFNTAAERMFGFARPDALGRKVGDLVVPEPQRPSHEEGLRRVAAGGEPRMLGRLVRMSARRSDHQEIAIELYLACTSEAPMRFTAWIRELSRSDGFGVADDKLALLEAGEQLGSVGSWEWTPSLRKLLWSDNVYRILGLRPGEVAPDPKVIVELTHPDDRARVRREQQELIARGEMAPVEYRIVRPGGEVRHLRTSLAVAEERDDQPYRFVGYVEDLTEQIRADRAIAAHSAVANAVAGWTSFEQSARALIAGLAAALDCDGGIIWLPRGDELVARMVWKSRMADEALLDPIRRGARVRRHDDLIWTAQSRRAATSTGSAVAIPAVFREDLLAIIELRSREDLALTDSSMRSLSGTGYELGQFLYERGDELSVPPLSPRELEVLACAAQGLTSQEIAERLFISTATVKTHFANIYPKLGVSDRAAAVAVGLRLGLID